MRKFFILNLLSSTLLLGSILPALAQFSQPPGGQSFSSHSGARIYSREVTILPVEQQAGIVSLNQVMPIFRRVNQERNTFKPHDFNYYIENFHYPNRQRFDLSRQQPPTHIVLHWTANKHVQNPLFTLSAFLRSAQRGTVGERQEQHKNVSNYFLTGTLMNETGQQDAYLIKLTQGDIKSWGDIPRVTAYPTNDAWDDNKYDGRGAIGIEIDGPDFRSIYNNPYQKKKLLVFMALILSQRGQYQNFKQLRQSKYWQDMQRVYAFLKDNVMAMDVNSSGGISPQFRNMAAVLNQIPSLPSDIHPEIKKIYSFISGHGVVALEYNERMIRSGRNRDAKYDKIDFTEPHVFVMAMELLNANIAMGETEVDIYMQEFMLREKELWLRQPASLNLGNSSQLLMGGDPADPQSLGEEKPDTRMLLLD